MILDYQTFYKDEGSMKDALLKESARRAVKFFRTYFLANFDPINILYVYSYYNIINFYLSILET